MSRDAGLGVAGIALAALYWWGADAIPTSPLDGGVGADGLPKALAWALGGLSVVLLVRGMRIFAPRAALPPGGDATAPASEAQSEAQGWRAHRRALGMLVIGVAYVSVVNWLGYALSVLGLFTAVAVYNGARPSWRLALVVVGMTALFHLLFVEFLSIPLPPGIWPELFGTLE